MLGQEISKLFWNELPPELIQNKVLINQTNDLLQEAVDFHPEILYLTLLKVNYMYDQSKDKKKIDLLLKYFRVKLEWNKTQFLEKQITYIENSDISSDKKEPAIEYLLDFIDEELDKNSNILDIPNRNNMNFIISKYYFWDPAMQYDPKNDYSALRDSLEKQKVLHLGSQSISNAQGHIERDRIEYLVDQWYLFSKEEYESQFYPLLVETVINYAPLQSPDGFDFQMSIIFLSQTNEIVVKGSDFPDSELSNLETSHPLFSFGVGYRHKLKSRKKTFSNIILNLNFGLASGDQMTSTTKSFSKYHINTPSYRKREIYYLGDRYNEFPGEIKYEEDYTFSINIFAGTPVWWITRDMTLELVLGFEYTATAYKQSFNYRYMLEEFFLGSWRTISTVRVESGVEDRMEYSIRVIPALGIRYSFIGDLYFNARIGYLYGDLSVGYSF